MARSTKNTPTPAKLDSIKHKDKRANIPTEELRDFVAAEEAAPKTMLYPRDASLDPQLVWKGKDEQDREDLTVPVVPIYIQEKIHPQAIIDDLLAQAARSKGDRVGEEPAQYGMEQPDLFADFNGGPVELYQKVEFYQHEQNWSNRMILGDSLLVMTSLAEKEGLKGKVQSIYLDPPYGIKFGSNWQVSTRKRDVKDGKAEDATRQPEQVRAFRDTWKLGIHSYLAYLRDRLVVARDLLTETGSVFVQIGDENVHLVRCVLDEVFGSENFVSQISFRTTGGRGAIYIDNVTNFLLWYGKDSSHLKYRRLHLPRTSSDGTEYDWVMLPNCSSVQLAREQLDGDEIILDGKRFGLTDLTSQGESQRGSYVFRFDGKDFVPRPGRHWSTTIEGLNKLVKTGRIQRKGENVFYRRFADDYPIRSLDSAWDDTAMGGFLRREEKLFVVQTPTRVISRCLLMTTDPGDLVLDPTCGSGTTAYVAEQWGRRWITCDTSRVALALARTRMMAAKYPYYLLADSPEGIKKETELTGKMPPDYKTESDIRKGFVYRRVPHVTLKSIANNPDIRERMTREQIDTAIARHADIETLYDDPYPDNKRVRVCGPFSVESLSPHRVLSTADGNMNGTVSEQEARKHQDFATMILDNLRKAGVQNTKKGERLKFDRLDPYAGRWLHAAGEYTESGSDIPSEKTTGKMPVPPEKTTGKMPVPPEKTTGKMPVPPKTRRVAVSIGPEHGTVGPQQVKEAAKEAVQGIGFDLLLVLGFAFDPHVAEEVKRYGKLTVLPTKMNPDLAMGDELLKKTGAGNLFMVFGEPDVEIKKQRDGKLTIAIKGVDVYDPTTGEVRSSSTDDIACWFIDTDYNGESFFVRHAYFTGAEEPYDKLKRALRAEIDEAAWSSLYSTVSRPFDPPETGKITVKVINHYGDEVLNVFET